jgi:hypothetical protein
MFCTNRPDNGEANGLGGRAEFPAIEDYDDMLYSSGDLDGWTITDADFTQDAGDDVGLIDLWLDSGGKDLYISGDNVVFDMAVNGGQNTLDFVTNRIGVTLQVPSIVNFIGNQVAPLVRAYPYNVSTQPVFALSQPAGWIAYGGCLGINTFDGVTPTGSAIKLAEFTDPDGNLGAYSFSAATLNIFGGVGNESRIVSTPYDLQYVYTASNAKVAAPKGARTLVLSDILTYFGVENDPGNAIGVDDLPGSKVFSVANYPNPFNPVTKIQYQIKNPGHMTLKVFNVRGELVKTLIDGRVEAGGEVLWDGTSDQGNSVSSGVYFYEARIGGEVKVNKMALVK